MRATDGVGNVDPTPASRAFTVEVAPPPPPPPPPPPATPTCDGLKATVVGTPGDDVLSGTSGRDVIVGLGGDDQISGGGGNDVICGGDGDDKLVGAAGNDLVLGEAGNDKLVGTSGNDHDRVCRTSAGRLSDTGQPGVVRVISTSRPSSPTRTS